MNNPIHDQRSPWSQDSQKFTSEQFSTERSTFIPAKSSTSAGRNHLATPQTRLIAFVLDGILFSLTLGIGWLVWFFIVAQRGTTPGHDLLGHEIVDHATLKPVGIGKLALRELVVKGFLSWLLASFTLFINYIVDGALILREDRRAGHDLLLGTVVIQVRSTPLLEMLEGLNKSKF
jgi:uncharacterized RDD family membrane protein YckC